MVWLNPAGYITASEKKKSYIPENFRLACEMYDVVAEHIVLQHKAAALSENICKLCIVCNAFDEIGSIC